MPRNLERCSDTLTMAGSNKDWAQRKMCHRNDSAKPEQVSCADIVPMVDGEAP